MGCELLDLDYARKFIDDVDYFGYYYKDVFYINKINRVEDNHINETLSIEVARHIFFEDMAFGELIGMCVHRIRMLPQY